MAYMAAEMGNIYLCYNVGLRQIWSNFQRQI